MNNKQSDKPGPPKQNVKKTATTTTVATTATAQVTTDRHKPNKRKSIVHHGETAESVPSPSDSKVSRKQRYESVVSTNSTDRRHLKEVATKVKHDVAVRRKKYNVMRPIYPVVPDKEQKFRKLMDFFRFGKRKLVRKSEDENLSNEDLSEQKSYDSFSKYVALQDIDLMNASQVERRDAYHHLEHHTMNIYGLFLLLCLLDALMAGISVYFFAKMPDGDARDILVHAFANWKHISNIFYVQILILVIPVLAIYILIYPENTKIWQTILKWGGIIVITLYIAAAGLWMEIHTYSTSDNMKKAMFDYMDKYSKEEVSERWRVIQNYFQCCGVDDYKDWLSKNKRHLLIDCCDTSTVKKPCFEHIDNITINEDNLDRIYKTGCLSSEFTLVNVVANCLAVLELTVVIVTIIILWYLVHLVQYSINNEVLVRDKGREQYFKPIPNSTVSKDKEGSGQAIGVSSDPSSVQLADSTVTQPLPSSSVSVRGK